MPDLIPCISLWQPYASLIFARDGTGSFIKKHETRGYRYPAKYDGLRIAIHATQVFPARRLISPELHDLCDDTFGCQYRETLPRGGVIGTVRIVSAIRTEHYLPDDDNFAAGDWSPGRWAWQLADPITIDGGKSFRPWKGKQGWFSVPATALATPRAEGLGDA